MDNIGSILIGAIQGKLGVYLMLLLSLASIFCLKIWLVAAALQRSIWWAIAVFIIPLADIVFVLFNWKAARKPFLYAILFILLAVAMLITRSVTQAFFNFQPIENDVHSSQIAMIRKPDKREFIRLPHNKSGSRLEFRLVRQGELVSSGDTLQQNDRRLAPEISLSGDDIEKVTVAEESNQAILNLQLSSFGARKLEDLTQNAIGRYLAITFDGHVLLVARIQEAITGGQLSIAGGLTLNDGERIAKGIVGESG